LPSDKSGFWSQFIASRLSALAYEHCSKNRLDYQKNFYIFIFAFFSEECVDSLPPSLARIFLLQYFVEALSHVWQALVRLRVEDDTADRSI
jgi:hypothetical protein